MSDGFAGHTRRHPSAHGDHFGDNGHRNFFRRNRADLQPYGSVYVGKFVGGDAFLFQLFVDGNCFPARADHAQIASVQIYRPAQNSHVVAVSAGDNHDVRRLGNMQPPRNVLEIFGDHLAGLGKTFAVGVACAVVHDDDVEAGDASNLVEVVGHVSGAEDVEQCRWKHRLDEHFQGSTANQTVVVLGIAVQVECECS